MSETLWITKSLTLINNRGTNKPNVIGTFIIAPPSNHRNLVVQFKGIIVTGTIYVGDTTLMLTDCTLNNLTVQQEFQRKLFSQLIHYIVEDDSITNSSFVTTPPSTQDTNILYKNVIKCQLSIQNVLAQGTFINISAMATDVKILYSQFSNTSNSQNSSNRYTGIYINAGVVNEQSTKRKKRRKRSLNEEVHRLKHVDTQSPHRVTSPARLRLKQLRNKIAMMIYKQQLTKTLTSHVHVERPFSNFNVINNVKMGIVEHRQYRRATTNMALVKIHHPVVKMGKDDHKHSRRRRAASGTGSAPEADASDMSILLITHTVFKGLNQKDISQQAALTLTLKSDYHITVNDCTFMDNERAINIEVLSNKKGYVNINNGNFTNNHALGPGGAVHVDVDNGGTNVKITNCTFINNIARNLKSQKLMADSQGETESSHIEVSKITGSGGAVAMNMGSTHPNASFSVEIFDCNFINNTAESYGGSIYLTSRVYAQLQRNTFSNTDAAKGIRPRVGDILESRGTLYMVNNTFNVKTAVNEFPVLSYRAETDGTFLETKMLDLTCPKGYNAIPIESIIESVGSSRVLVEALLVYCRSCSSSQYSLDISHITVTQTNVLDFIYHTNATCQDCPYGAVCNVDVVAKANYWGLEADGSVHMYNCPENYCCQESQCHGYDICAANRIGTMCGKCDMGYSESLFSENCIHDAQCSYATWFWLVIAAYGLLYVMFFIFEEELQIIVKSFSSWLTEQVRKCKRKKSAGDNVLADNETDLTVVHDSRNTSTQNSIHTSHQDDEEEGAYLQIAMYYFQVPSLLKIKILYQGIPAREVPLEYMTNYIKNIFSFNTFGVNFNTCLFKGVTSVFKVWIKSAYIIYLFVLWGVMFMFGGLIKACNSNRGCPCPWPVNIHTRARFLGALVNLLLYTYQYFAETSFSLLKCVNIVSENNSVLFIDANVHCFQDWQWGVLAFVCVYVFPFFIVLFLAPSLLRRRLIPVRSFMLCLIFPLIGTPFLLYQYCKHYDPRQHNKEYREVKASEAHHASGSVDVIVRIVSEPYKQNLKGGLCWEGMIALRRLLLVLIATLVTSVIFRHIGLVIVCFACLMLHIRIKPFIKASSNTLETVSLTVLLFIAIMNLLKASYFDSGEIPKGTADLAFQIYDWFEVIMLGFLPAIVVGFAIIAILTRVLAFCFGKCCCSRDDGYTSDDDQEVTPYSYNYNKRLPRHPMSDVQHDMVGYAIPYNYNNTDFYPRQEAGIQSKRHLRYNTNTFM